MMKMFSVSILSAMVMLLTSCATSQNVSFKEAHNYYANRDEQPGKLMKITDRESLERYFGYAPVMGKDGEPTPIDFNRQFVIGRTFSETDTATTIKPLSLIKTKEGKLHLTYQIVKEGGKRSFSILPFLMIVVDNTYKDLPLSESVTVEKKP